MIGGRATLCGGPRGVPIFLAFAWLAVAVQPVSHSQSGQASQPLSELTAMAHPDLVHYDEPVQNQLRDSRQTLDEMLADPAVELEELHLAIADMGQLYLLYDIPDLAEICFDNALLLNNGDFRWHYYLGTMYQLDGRLEEAAASLAASLELNPGYIATLIRSGEVDLLLGLFAEAEEFFLRALELDPASAAAHDGLGRIASSRGDTAAAIEHFERALELQPEADSIHYRLGMAYRQAGDIDQARSQLALNRGERIRFNDPLMEGLGALVRGKQVEFNLGVDAMRAGDHRVAVRHFRLAFEENPDDHLIPFNIASAMTRLGDRAGAEEWFRKSIEVNPEFRNGHFNLATMLVEDGRYQEAAHHFGRAHQIDPEDQAARLEWATALNLIGQTDRAIEELQKLLALDSRNAPALFNLGTLQAQLGEFDQAAESFNKILQVSEDPGSQARARLRLAYLAEQSGDAETARRQLELALELQPELVAAREGLASLLGRMGRFSEAADQFESVIALQPDSLQAHFGRAMARILGEEYVKARQSLEASTEALPDAVVLQHALARLLATCPEPTIRDGQRGLELAMGIFDIAATLDHAETVAMALAEVGRFDEAITWQQRVVDEAIRQGEKDRAAAAQRLLSRYQRGEPVRAPWQGD